MNWRRQFGRSEPCRFLEIWRAGRPDLQDHLLNRDRRRLFEREQADAGVRFQVFNSNMSAAEMR